MTTINPQQHQNSNLDLLCLVAVFLENDLCISLGETAGFSVVLHLDNGLSL